MIDKKLMKAIVALREDVGTIRKDSKGGSGNYSYRYASLPVLLKKIAPAMAKNGLAFAQMPDGVGRLRTVVCHEDGGEIEGVIEMKATDDKAQTYGSMLTYMRRYALVAMLGLNVDDDDDGAVASAPAARRTEADVTGGVPSF